MDIETRLRALPKALTLRAEDLKAMARLDAVAPRQVEPAPRTQLRVAAGAVAGALILLVLVNTMAVYFAPRYGVILADTPGLGPLSGRFLQAVGLSGSDVTVVGDSATSSGHTLKLEGAYADGLRTVLFVSIDGKGVTGNPKRYGTNPGEWGINDFTLTDQFGHSYQGWGVGGPTDLQFEALAWPASVVGGRLTLEVTGIWAIWKFVAQGPGVIGSEALTVHGDWSLHVTITSQKVASMAPPAPVRTPEAVYTYTSVVASGKTLIVHWTITGPATSRFAPPSLPDSTGPPPWLDFFSPRVFDANGDQMQLQYFGAMWPPKPGGPVTAEMAAFIHGPGQYRILVAKSLTAPDQQRWIVVP